MSEKRSKRWYKILFGQFIVTFLILAIGSCLVFYSEGYTLNLKNFKIIKNGVISLKSEPSPDFVAVNNTLYPYASIYSRSFYQLLAPGYYDIKLVKGGFSEWRKLVLVEPEMVEQFSVIKLFKSDIKSEILKNQNKIDYLNNQYNSYSNSPELQLKNDSREIWIKESLVTRFSKSVFGVVWYPDYNHVVYQKLDEIRVIENDGFNDTLLVKLSSEEPTKFLISEDGKELYYLDDGYYKIAIIR